MKSPNHINTRNVQQRAHQFYPLPSGEMVEKLENGFLLTIQRSPDLT